eukprot:TRINITY_DN13628_c0_g1_i1.p1 TRINITY_DN13628_c0_g1~~TRINITY_DN13628_c0_g1_i1.p1  ORF type:complete len:707 (-),score=130.46 TRINITY_DN13628_c0_g1_i1:33-2153(-)
MRVVSLLVLSVMVSTCFAQPPSDWVNAINSGNMLYSTYEPDQSIMASVGNGFLATVIGSTTIYVNGVFNGLNSITPSHRARIPSTVNTDIVNSTLYAAGLDMQNGIYYRRSTLNDYEGVTVEQSWYAHREIRTLLVNQIKVNVSAGSNEVIQIDTIFNPGPESTDFNFTITELHEGSFIMEGKIVQTEEPDSEDVVVVVVFLPAFNFTLARRNEPFTSELNFYTIIRTSLDSYDPYFDAVEDYFNIMDSSPAQLLSSHVAAWQEIWESGIEIGGNLPLAQAVNSSLYYILSSIRNDWEYSLSPGGLASDGYNGHAFWDVETWMYPSLALLYQDLADIAITYRYNRIPGAEAKAKSYDKGYEGTMYPWESAFTGQEVCPSWSATGAIEIHISGDISFALRQYWYLTQNQTWLENIGWPVIEGIATFYSSRVTFNSTTQQYDIVGVIPPDEYAVNVTNSYYTNVVAIYSIEFAIEVANILGYQNQIPSIWKTLVAPGAVALPFDEKLQIHLEYDGYNGSLIKQADIVLLAYPLMYPMNATVMKNDLVYYSNRTDSGGPAMTYGIHSIIWLQLGYIENANDLFNKSYANIHAPFNVWMETPTGGAVNFITGAGGFLQAVFAGYGGIRITPNGITGNPNLPKGSSFLKLRGVEFLGSTIDISFDGKTISILLQNAPSSAPTLFVTSSQGTVKLFAQKQLSLSPGLFNIHQ